MPNRRILFNVEFLGPYYGHVWAILGPCFGYCYSIQAMPGPFLDIPSYRLIVSNTATKNLKNLVQWTLRICVVIFLNLEGNFRPLVLFLKVCDIVSYYWFWFCKGGANTCCFPKLFFLDAWWGRCW